MYWRSRSASLPDSQLLLIFYYKIYYMSTIKRYYDFQFLEFALGNRKYYPDVASTDHVFTGSIARSASLPVFSLLRGRVWGVWGWNFKLAWPPCQISPHWCNDKGVGTPKLKFVLRFDLNVEYKRPAGAYPLRDFHKICRVCTSFQDA